ncbi:MAG: tyrosine-type recombinase/integrase [Nitrospinales bacterium]
MGQIRYRDGKVYLYRRENSRRWQARIKLKNGKWKRISTGKNDLNEAAKIACEQYDEFRVLQKRNLIFESRSFKDVAKIAIKEMQKELDSGYGKKSFVDYIQALNKYFIPYFGKTHVCNIDIKSIKGFDIWRIEQVKRLLKHSTLNNHNAALRRVLKVAIDRGWIHAYQVPELKNKGTKSKRRSNFTIKEYLKIMRFMRSWCQKGRTEKVQLMRELLRDYISILINTGMRHGTETYNLKWKHIETIEHNGRSYLRIWVNGKTGERELIARKNVRRYLERIRQRFGYVKCEDYVFRLRNGERSKYLDGTFQNLLVALGLLNDRHGNARTLYSLRHTYATVQIIAGIDYHKLAKNMGTSIAMLERHYSHLTPTLAAEELA